MKKTKDLFEVIETLPEAVQEIIEYYEMKAESGVDSERSERLSEGLNYKDCEQFNNELKIHGYSFSYGLDCVPFNLKRIEFGEV